MLPSNSMGSLIFLSCCANDCHPIPLPTSLGAADASVPFGGPVAAGNDSLASRTDSFARLSD